MSQPKAISATVTGGDQKVGFRAMVMKQAIEHNLAGMAANQPNMIVSFTLQGDGTRIDKAIASIDEGTKRSAGVSVSASPSTTGPQAPGGSPSHTPSSSRCGMAAAVAPKSLVRIPAAGWATPTFRLQPECPK
jgi:acylphosphatase